MVSNMDSAPSNAYSYVNGIIPPTPMSLNLGAIHPSYSAPEFEWCYMKHLAENMTNESWIEINLDQRMWVARWYAFANLYQHDLFPEWERFESFNTFVIESCHRREHVRHIAEPVRTLRQPRSLSEILKPDLAELSNGFLITGPVKHQLPKKTPQEAPRVSKSDQPLVARKAGEIRNSLELEVLARYAEVFVGREGRNCQYWIKELTDISQIFLCPEQAVAPLFKSRVGNSGKKSVKSVLKMRKLIVVSGGPLVRNGLFGKRGPAVVEDLVKDFNFKAASGNFNCEWLNAVDRSLGPDNGWVSREGRGPGLGGY